MDRKLQNCKDDIEMRNATYDLFNFALLCTDIMCVFLLVIKQMLQASIRSTYLLSKLLSVEQNNSLIENLDLPLI